MDPHLPRKVALRCLARTGAINAAVTARGMQQLGLQYVLAPALRYLYPDPEQQQRAFARYDGHSNTHAFMLPCYAGLLLNVEQQLARGVMSESTVTSVRQAVPTTLSALGDSFFSGALNTTWALITICLILQGQLALAAVFTGLLLVLLTLFRIYGFFYCLRHGVASLMWLKKLDVISWTERIKIGNAVLIALTLCCMFRESMQSWPLLAQVGTFLLIPVGALLVGKLHMPRAALWVLVLGAVILEERGFISFF